MLPPTARYLSAHRNSSRRALLEKPLALLPYSPSSARAPRSANGLSQPVHPGRLDGLGPPEASCLRFHRLGRTLRQAGSGRSGSPPGGLAPRLTADPLITRSCTRRPVRIQRPTRQCTRRAGAARLSSPPPLPRSPTPTLPPPPVPRRSPPRLCSRTPPAPWPTTASGSISSPLMTF